MSSRRVPTTALVMMEGATVKARVCNKCGSNIFADAPGGFCSVCLFRTGLGPLADGVDEEPSREFFDPELEDYEVLEEIGRGGQGIVYRARQKSLNRTVALKVIGAARWATEAHLRRFRIEAEAAASLTHPSIVPIHEIRDHGGYCFFSMSLVEGGPLDQVATNLSPRRSAELIAKVARAVHYAHERGILHRDIKPGNILIDAQGEPHLSDFGLARLNEGENGMTRTTDVLGTPSYMAPEQARGGNSSATRASDVYGLGAVLYQLLTGRPPFVAATPYETVQLLLGTEPRPPRLMNTQVDRDLSTVCLKCLEKDSAQRYSSAVALAEDLERWLRHQPIQARRSGVITRGRKWLKRNPAIAALVLAISCLILAAGIIFRQSSPTPPATGLAVLPFTDLSATKENTLLADGIQDDILTKLAHLSQLKVVSRTSVMPFRGAHDAREIGRALNVSHLLEGSVRREGDRIHLNAQLIDARTDKHLWAEEYDRPVNEVFRIEGDLAQRLAEELRVAVYPSEKAAIDRPPTTDITAFDFFTRAKSIYLAATNSNSAKEDLLAAADLLNQALARDSSYFDAYCQLAAVHDLLYLLGHDHSPRRLALAEEALIGALRLRPEAGETHLARANHFYSGYLNYEAALSELELARKNLPNDCRVFELGGLIRNRQGKFREAVSELEYAVRLDPRNVYRYLQVGVSYWCSGDFKKAAAANDRAIEIEPHNAQIKALRADYDIATNADTRAFRQLVSSLRKSNPRALHEIADSWVWCALADRDPVAARAALIAAGENTPLNDNAVHFSRAFVEGWIARLEKDEGKARSAFEEARREQAEIVETQPDDVPALCVLGAIDAALGRKEEALSEGRRAIALLPAEKDVFNGSLMIQWYAASAALVGETDLALEQLAKPRPVPIVSYGALKLLPFWDSLRGDSRFEQIVASLAPTGSGHSL